MSATTAPEAGDRRAPAPKMSKTSTLGYTISAGGEVVGYVEQILPRRYAGTLSRLPWHAFDAARRPVDGSPFRARRDARAAVEALRP